MECATFNVEVYKEADQLTAKVSGDLDFANAPKLLSIIQSEMAVPCDALIFDFSNVTFLDSEGIKALVVIYRTTVDAGGTGAITKCSDCVSRLLEISGLSSALGVTC